MSGRIPLGAGLFFALLVVSLVVAVLVVRARDPDLVLEVRAGLPCSLDLRDDVGAPEQVPIKFFVRESDDAARIAIVDSHEDLVATLDASVPLIAHERVTYAWDGRTDDGSVAPAGRYRLMVELPEHDREIVWPGRISLDVPSTAEPCGDSGEGVG